MFRFPSNVMGVAAAIVCQGSWAPCAQAEKAELHAADTTIPARLDHPSNLLPNLFEVGRDSRSVA